jgi:hypothetical protein
MPYAMTYAMTSYNRSIRALRNTKTEFRGRSMQHAIKRSTDLIERDDPVYLATFQDGDFAKLLVKVNAEATCRQPIAAKAYAIENGILQVLDEQRGSQ